MKLETVFKLIDAGFDRAEIEKLDAALEEPKKEPEPEKEPEPKKEPEKDTEPEKKKEPEPQSAPDMLKFISEEFKKMTEEIQKTNILNSNNKQLDTKTGEETLAEILAPPEEKRR